MESTISSAQSIIGPREVIASESRRVTVKGADVSGIELVVRELAAVRGRLVLEITTAADCKNKRQPLLSETVLVAQYAASHLWLDASAKLKSQGLKLKQFVQLFTWI
jgi:hypothetical protein